MAEKLSAYNASDYLHTEEEIRVYLDACATENNLALMEQARKDVAEARRRLSTTRDSHLTAGDLRTDFHDRLEVEKETPASIKLMIDMDGVLCDLASAYARAGRERPEVEFPQSIPGIFEGLDPIPGAIDAVNRLRERFDVWILSAPSVRNPHCYSEKRIWIERHFDLNLAYKLILAHDKSLIRGDILIDDHIDGKGQERFSGRLIHFGGKEFPDWSSVEMALIDAG